MYRTEKAMNEPGRGGLSPLMKVVLSVLATVVVLAVVGTVSYLMDLSQINHDGTHWENTLTSEDAKAWQILSAYYTNSENSLHIADRNADKLKELLTAIATGQRGNAADLQSANNVVYTQLSAAYPQLGSSTYLYEHDQDIMVGGFNNYVNENTVLYSMVSGYKDWLYGSFINRGIIASQGYPSDLLSTPDGLTGPKALKAMQSVVANPSVAQSYKNGALAPIAFPTP